MLETAAPVEIATFDLSCTPVDVAPLAVAIPGKKKPAVAKSLLIGLGNEAFALVDSAPDRGTALTLSKNESMLSPGLMAKTIPRLQCKAGTVCWQKKNCGSGELTVNESVIDRLSAALNCRNPE